MQPRRAPRLVRPDPLPQDVLRLRHVQAVQVDLVRVPAGIVDAEDVVACLAVVFVADAVILLALDAELLGQRLLPGRVRRARPLEARVAFGVLGVRQFAEPVVFRFVGGAGRVGGYMLWG